MTAQRWFVVSCLAVWLLFVVFRGVLIAEDTMTTIVPDRLKSSPSLHAQVRQLPSMWTLLYDHDDVSDEKGKDEEEEEGGRRLLLPHRNIRNDVFDFCAAEGLAMQSSLRNAWTWFFYFPRRMMSFYTGSESCDRTTDLARQSVPKHPRPVVDKKTTTRSEAMAAAAERRWKKHEASHQRAYAPPLQPSSSYRLSLFNPWNRSISIVASCPPLTWSETLWESAMGLFGGSSGGSKSRAPRVVIASPSTNEMVIGTTAEYGGHDQLQSQFLDAIQSLYEDAAQHYNDHERRTATTAGAEGTRASSSSLSFVPAQDALRLVHFSADAFTAATTTTTTATTTTLVVNDTAAAAAHMSGGGPQRMQQRTLLIDLDDPHNHAHFLYHDRLYLQGWEKGGGAVEPRRSSTTTSSSAMSSRSEEKVQDRTEQEEEEEEVEEYRGPRPPLATLETLESSSSLSFFFFSSPAAAGTADPPQHRGGSSTSTAELHYFVIPILSEFISIECGSKREVHMLPVPLYTAAHPLHQDSPTQQPSSLRSESPVAFSTTTPVTHQQHVKPSSAHSPRELLSSNVTQLPPSSPLTSVMPASSVLVLFFDAVSRQAARRNLPLFTTFLNGRLRRQLRDTHVFVELKGLTTLGHSTAKNLGPLLSGHRVFDDETPIEIIRHNFLPRVLKRWYGPKIRNSIVTGFCEDSGLAMFSQPLRREHSLSYFGGRSVAVANLIRANTEKDVVTVSSLSGTSSSSSAPLSADHPTSSTDGGQDRTHPLPSLLLREERRSSSTPPDWFAELPPLDRDTALSVCDTEYASAANNFRGPYSIVKRCMGPRHVHQHVMGYSHAALREDLVDIRRANLLQRRKRSNSMEDDDSSALLPSLFFQFVNFMEGHEGTHGVIGQVDADLTAFVEALLPQPSSSSGRQRATTNEALSPPPPPPPLSPRNRNKRPQRQQKIREEEEERQEEDDILQTFFSSQENILLLASDHGNHMGPFYEWTLEGEYERSTPMSLLVIPRRHLRELDAYLSRKEGETLRVLEQRASQLSTSADTYLTLLELLGLDVSSPSSFSDASTRAKQQKHHSNNNNAEAEEREASALPSFADSDKAKTTEGAAQASVELLRLEQQQRQPPPSSLAAAAALVKGRDMAPLAAASSVLRPRQVAHVTKCEDLQAEERCVLMYCVAPASTVKTRD